MWACFQKNGEIIEMLLNSGINVNDKEKVVNVVFLHDMISPLAVVAA